MFTRRIRSLFALFAAALLLLVLCCGDGALSINGQALPILMYHDVVAGSYTQLRATRAS